MPPISLRSPHTLDEPKLEALIEIMFLAAYADGPLGEEERRHFAQSVQSLTDRKVTGDVFDNLVERLVRSRREVGTKARMAVAREVLGSVEACKVALSLAVGVILSDGVIRPSERAMCLEIADALGIDRDSAEQLLREAQGA
ncbi:tellurite resistance TerB family protein [Polyangium aurulentum]|uniref:tellurite resistance TerB family protein n=1 Tax=Polyangium aurulentum TaxID=2567896 RepID=UPI0010AE504E|nr:tellurite resistance TerB family protein [Polyangium aurulentum]UQA58204.1 tellurite resistance TerB family protein [Polyangium aurulentum]